MEYPKPERFSDPYSDWDGCEDMLDAILAKEDAALTTDDFRVIFAKFLPAADYREGAYYIEKCLAHIAGGREVHDGRMPEGFLWWLGNFRGDLVRDGLYAEVKRSVVAAFWGLLDDFALFDLSEAECARLGRSFEWSVGPYNQHTVHDFVDELAICDEFEPELNAILDGLAASVEPAHVRWFIEIAAHSRIWMLLHGACECEGNGLENYERKEAVFHRLHRFADFTWRYEVARDAARAEGKSKYVARISPF